VQLLPAGSARHDELCVFEHPQMFHHTEAGHLQVRLELGERAAVTLVEPVEQETPSRVCQCLEHAVVVRHRPDDR
jgi:hypothetical protein